MSRYKYFNTVPQIEEVLEEKVHIPIRRYLLELHLENSRNISKQIAANLVHIVQEANKYSIFSAFCLCLRICYGIDAIFGAAYRYFAFWDTALSQLFFFR